MVESSLKGALFTFWLNIVKNIILIFLLNKWIIIINQIPTIEICITFS